MANSTPPFLSVIKNGLCEFSLVVKVTEELEKLVLELRLNNRFGPSQPFGVFALIF
jgi:hypothetical protein